MKTTIRHRIGVAVLTACLIFSRTWTAASAEEGGRLKVDSSVLRTGQHLKLEVPGKLTLDYRFILSQEGDVAWLETSGVVTNTGESDEFFSLFISLTDQGGSLVAALQETNFPFFPLKMKSSKEFTNRAPIPPERLSSVTNVMVRVYQLKAPTPK